MVYKDRVVEVPTPVVQPVDPRLLGDCAPVISLPGTGALTINDLLERLGAVEFALDLCRNDKAELRKSQPVP